MRSGSSEYFNMYLIIVEFYDRDLGPLPAIKNIPRIYNFILVWLLFSITIYCAVSLTIYADFNLACSHSFIARSGLWVRHTHRHTHIVVNFLWVPHAHLEISLFYSLKIFTRARASRGQNILSHVSLEFTGMIHQLLRGVIFDLKISFIIVIY